MTEQPAVNSVNHLSNRNLITVAQRQIAKRFEDDVADARRWKQSGRLAYKPAAQRLRHVLAELGELRLPLFAVVVKGQRPDEWATANGYEDRAGIALLCLALDAAGRAYAAEKDRVALEAPGAAVQRR